MDAAVSGGKLGLFIAKGKPCRVSTNPFAGVLCFAAGYI
jgi:hypothetical protein